jgi:hypothetical protein
MGIDHKKIHAAASASFCVRSSMGAALLCCGLLGASLAQADSGDGPRREEQRNAPVREHVQQQNQPQPRQQAERQADPRQLDPRSYEARAEEQRRAMQEAGRNAEMSRRVGRLTPDERRDLRRQINEVGQDIYANPPRH